MIDPYRFFSLDSDNLWSMIILCMTVRPHLNWNTKRIHGPKGGARSAQRHFPSLPRSWQTNFRFHIATFLIALLLRPRMRIRLLSLLRKLFISSRQPWITSFRLLRRFIERLLSNPQIAELWRFIFLGTVVETGRIIGQKAVEAISSCMTHHFCPVTKY